MSHLFNKTLIIGLGLIGGSFAKALRAREASREIAAFDEDEEIIELAQSEKVIDYGAHDLLFLEDELSGFDLVVLATPLNTYENILKKIAPKISKNCLLVDLGSIKEIEAKLRFLSPEKRKNFVPCHPIAGSEKNGFENSTTELFSDKKFIICPEFSDKSAVEKISSLIAKIDGHAEFLEAKKHDEIYALVSHLPQFLSFLTKDFSPKNIKDKFFCNAFRLDNSSPEIWSEIFALNEKNLEKFYLKFFANLEKNISLEKFCLQKESAGKFDQKFFEENFAAIFFRFLVVYSYLQIPEIKTFSNYTGSGFKDFTSITGILNYDEKKLTDLIRKNHQKIKNLFQKISDNS